jgi:hypothetical protein
LEFPKGYEEFEQVFQDALDRTSTGKGMERHGYGREFKNQPIMYEMECHGTPSPMIWQARKKALESLRLEPSAAYKEIIDAIVYLVAVGLWYKGKEVSAFSKPDELQFGVGHTSAKTSDLNLPLTGFANENNAWIQDRGWTTVKKLKEEGLWPREEQHTDDDD